MIDATGLNGTYDICLGFSRNKPGTDSSMPDSDIFEAIREQSGLYLSPKKRPVQMVIIDHVERATPN